MCCSHNMHTSGGLDCQKRSSATSKIVGYSQSYEQLQKAHTKVISIELN